MRWELPAALHGPVSTITDVPCGGKRGRSAFFCRGHLSLSPRRPPATSSKREQALPRMTSPTVSPTVGALRIDLLSIKTKRSYSRRLLPLWCLRPRTPQRSPTMGRPRLCTHRQNVRLPIILNPAKVTRSLRISAFFPRNVLPVPREQHVPDSLVPFLWESLPSFVLQRHTLTSPSRALFKHLYK